MFDTLRLIRPAPDLDRIVSGLDKCEERVQRETGTVYYVGFAGPLYVRATPKRLRVQGSLARWLRHLGWRGASPTRDDVRAARAALESRLGTNLGDAHVWRADVYADLTLPSPARCYLPLLLARSRSQRSEHDGTSVYFSTEQRVAAFYDKDAEQGTCRATGALLRVEVRLLKRLAEQMGRPVTFADLHDPPLWAAFVDVWQREYDAVEKGRALHAPTGKFGWRDHMTLTAVQLASAGPYVQFFRDEYGAGRLTRSQYHSARKAILKAGSDPALTSPSPHVEALDVAIADAARRMREAGR